MCSPKRPKMEPLPIPPQPQTTVTEDEAVLREGQRERRRAASRQGRQSTILAGADPMSATAPTGQSKQLIGS